MAAELQRLSEKPEQHEQAAEMQEDARWASDHMKLAQQRGIPWPLPQTPELLRNPWFTSSLKREQEVLLFKLPEGHRYIDTSQSVNRATASRDGSKLFTILPGAHIWATSLNRYLIGTDHLHLQGIPHDRFTDLSERQKADLAGNSFTTTCVMAVLCAIIAQAEPHASGQSDDTDDDDLENLMQYLR